MDLWQRIQATLNQGVSTSHELLTKAKGKAKDLGEKGILNIEIRQLESQVEKLSSQLGVRVYTAFKKEERGSVTKNTAGVKELLEQIAEVEQKIAEREEQLKKFE